MARNHVYKFMLLAIFLYPLVPDALTPYIGLAMGMIFLLYLILEKDALSRIRRGRRQMRQAFSLPFFFLILLTGISLFYSKNREVGVPMVFEILTAVVMFMILKYELNRPNYTVPLTRAFFISNFLVAFYHVGQVLQAEVVKGVPFDALTRSSTLSSSPLLAYFLLIPLFPALTLYIYKDTLHDARFYLALITVCLISIFMTGNRIAIVGVFIGLALLSLLYSLKFVVALIPTGLFLLLIPIFSQRHRPFLELYPQLGRWRFWGEILIQNKNRLIFGQGIGTTDSLVASALQGKVTLSNLELIHKPYNLLLQAILEVGVPGLILLLLVGALVIRSVARYTRSIKATPYMRVMAVGILVALVVLVTLNGVDSYLLHPKILYSITILMGILLGDARQKSIHGV